MTTYNQAMEERLSQLWQQGAREVAVSFLRRAVHPNLTLAELELILRFDSVNSELGKIRLQEILTGGEFDSDGSVNSRLSGEAAQRASRRRSPQQTEEMKGLLLATLEANESGLTTPELGEILNSNGYPSDGPIVTQILRALEADNAVQGNDGRPKTWRIKR